MSDDLIKRSDAIKATWQEPTYTDPLNVLTEVRDRIEAIPSADTDISEYSDKLWCNAYERGKADRLQGEWKWNKNGMDWGIGCWCCSECGMRNPYIGSGDTALLSNPHNWAGSKYCPNCGAKMKGADDDTI